MPTLMFAILPMPTLSDIQYAIKHFPPFAYWTIAVCLLVQLGVFLYGCVVLAHATENPTSVVAEAIEWEPDPPKLALGDATSDASFGISQFRLLVNWLHDSAKTTNSHNGQRDANHVLFHVKSVPLAADVGKISVKVRMSNLNLEGAETVTLAILPVVRRDSFVHIQGIKQSTGEPSMSRLEIEKRFNLDSLAKGDRIELVVLVKASNSTLFDRIKFLPQSQLFTVDAQVNKGAK